MQHNKISSIFEALDMGDAKSALKIFNKEMEKNGKNINKYPAAKISAKLTKSAILSAAGKM